MFDPAEGEADTFLDAKMRAWTVAMFRLLGFGEPSHVVARSSVASGSGGPPNDPDKGPEPDVTGEGLDARRLVLAQRLNAITLSPRLPTEQRVSVEGQVARARSLLEAAKGKDDLDAVETAVADLENVANGLNAEGARREKQADGLAGILKGQKLPDSPYLAASERPDLDRERLAILMDLSGPIGDVGLGRATAAVQDLIGRLNIAVALGQGRERRCQAVNNGLATVQRPVGGEAADYVAYDAELPSIAALANLPVGDNAIAGAEAALFRLKAEAARLATVFAGRQERAKAVRDAIPALMPVGANATETEKVGLIEKDCLAALGTPEAVPTVAALARAEGLLVDRAALLSEIVVAIGNRDKLRAAVKGALEMVDLSGIGEAEGLATLQAEARSIADGLPIALDDPALALLSSRVEALAKAADDARGVRAGAILSALDQHKLPPDLPVADAGPLTQIIEAIRKGATAPLTGAGLNESAAALATLPKLLQDAADALVLRAGRITDAANAAALVADPKDANAVEKAELKLLREAPALTPAKPFTEDAAVAAEAALKALNDKRAELVLLIAAREKKRVETLDRLLVLVPPMSATGAEAVKVLKQGGTLRKTVEQAATVIDIEGAEVAIKALEKDVKDITDLAAARNKSTLALTAAQALFKATAARLNLGCHETALAMLQTAAGQIDTATTSIHYQAADVVIAGFAPFLTEAESYLPAMQQWRYDAALYLGALPEGTPTDLAKKAAMKTWRDTLLQQADLLADAADIVGAKAKLAEFFSGNTTFADPGNGGNITPVAVDAAVNTDAKAFATRVALFAKDSLPTHRLVEKLKLPQKAEAFQNIFDKAKKKGYESGLWNAAIADLDTFALQLTAYKPVVEAYQRYLPLVGDVAVDAAITTLKTECTNRNYPAALLAMTGLDAAHKDKAEFTGKVNALTRRVEGAINQLTGAAKARVETPWNDAAAQPTHAEKMTMLAEAETQAGEAAKMTRARDAAVALKNRLDNANLYDVLADAAAKETNDSFAAAQAAYDAAIKDYDRLSAYLGAVAVLGGVKAALPVTAVEAIKTITDALAAADLKAKARLWDAADAALLPAQTLPVVVAVSAEQALYLARRKALEKTQTRLVAAIPEAAVVQQLTVPWQAATDMADVNHDYVAATELLDAHAPLLGTVQAYVGAAARARKGLDAMKRIETAAIAVARRAAAAPVHAALKTAKADEVKALNKAATDKVPADLPGAKQPAKNKYLQSKASADNASLLVVNLTASLANDILLVGNVAAAAKTAAIFPLPDTKAKLDNDLAAANLEAANGKFAVAKGLFEAICVAAKTGMDAAAQAIEAVDNGHYITAHGPTVTDADHKKRLTTGIRPDGKKEPARNSSQFGDVEGMLSTRETAIELAAAKYTATTIASVKVGDTLSYVIPQESATPVGKSFMSDSVKKDLAGGEFKETDMCENYREYAPLTKVFTKIIFHFADPDPTIATPKAITNFVDADKAYNKYDAVTGPPADYPGRWVVHQHYPTAEGFDPDKGAYVD